MLSKDGNLENLKVRLQKATNQPKNKNNNRFEVFDDLR